MIYIQSMSMNIELKEQKAKPLSAEDMQLLDNITAYINSQTKKIKIKKEEKTVQKTVYTVGKLTRTKEKEMPAHLPRIKGKLKGQADILFIDLKQIKLIERKVPANETVRVYTSIINNMFPYYHKMSDVIKANLESKKEIIALIPHDENNNLNISLSGNPLKTRYYTAERFLNDCRGHEVRIYKFSDCSRSVALVNIKNRILFRGQYAKIQEEWTIKDDKTPLTTVNRKLSRPQDSKQDVVAPDAALKRKKRRSARKQRQQKKLVQSLI
jgi:hypothetical protein